MPVETAAIGVDDDEIKSVELDWNLLYNEYPHRYHEFAIRQDWEGNTLAAVAGVTSAIGKNVLDIGSGTGRYAFDFAASAAKVWSVEPCLPMLEVGRRRAEAEGLTNIEFINASAQQIDLPDQCTDIVFAGHSINAVSAREYRPGVGWISAPVEERFREKAKAVDELIRLVRPGGWIFSLASASDNYGGELCDYILQDAREVWSAGKRRFLSWMENEYGAKSTPISADWVFDSPEQAARVFGFVYGEKVMAFIRERGIRRIENKLVLQYFQRS